MKWGWQILATLVALGCVAQLGCSDWFSGSHHHTVTTGGTSSSPTGTTSSNGTSGGSQGTSTINPSYTYGTTDSGPTGLCEHPGDGPELPFDGAYSGRFPLKPILALYDKADCRTFSPAFIRRLVTDLTGYLAGSVELTATPGDLTAATVELVGLPESTIRELLGFDSSETTSDGLRRVIALYVRSYDGGEGAKAWSQFLAGQTLGGYLEDALSQLVTGMRLAWGAPATASALGVSEAELAAASVSDDALYREVLGVTKTEALQLLDEHKLTSDDTLDEFLSLIHVSRPLDGKRFAYAFVVDGDLTPVRNLNRGDFQVRVDGDSIPTSDLTVHTLAELAKNDAQTVQFAISFVLDYSGSMSSKDKAFLEEALLFFLEQLPPVYRASVTKFDNRVSTYQELTRDVEKLKSAITRPMSSGGTALYDAIGAGIEELRDESVPFRLQLVFTDGMENSSKHHCHDSVVAFSRQQAVPVFVMGMGDIDVPAMLTLTNDTNACFLYAPSSDQIKQIYQVIASVMAQTYVISWPLRHSDATTVTIDATTPAGPVGDSYTIKP